MNRFLFILILLMLQNCSKPKTVLICGDHICVNKKEAEQYFEENLSIEVKVLNRKEKKNNFNLVELNLNSDFKDEKKISINQKKSTKEEVKVLTNKQIKEIKNNIKKKGKKKKFVKKISNLNNNKNKKLLRQNTKNITDVCLIVKNCNIDEISKYLLNQAKKKKIPDITLKE
jgi:hypothetical protein